MADQIISILNDLVETSKDGEDGFRAAAEDTVSAELRALFLRRAENCRSSVVDLQQLITQLGGEPETSGSIAGAMHRGWVHLKASVSGRPDLAILEECERGEDLAKYRYSEALDRELPDTVRMVVQRQYDGAVQNHDQIRALRDRYRAQAV
jgi:uncharacterized protein (TIGR02284 family)